MPAYHFHLLRGTARVEDQDGQDLADDQAAVAEGRNIVRELIVSAVQNGLSVVDRALEVTDDTGRSVAVIRFEDVVRRDLLRE